MYSSLQPSHFFIGAIAALAFVGIGYVTFPTTPSLHTPLPLVAAVEDAVTNDPNMPGAIPTQASAAGFEVENQLLSQILEINTIKLDTNFFQSAVFISLIDFSRDLTAQPVGRLDPFAPVNGSAVGSQASSSPVR